MTPQVATVLKHLKQHGSISQAEASTVYRIRALPRRIADLRASGIPVTSVLKKDATGQRYARYTLAPMIAVGDRVKVVKDESSCTRRHLGKSGVVTSITEDNHSKYGHDYLVILDGDTRSTYLWGTEIELDNK
jgi:hypothetical protein